MKSVRVPKRALILVVALFALVNLLIPVLGVHATTDEPEVIVEVAINKHDEEFIAGIEFDDGTKVGDYNYVIRYIPTPRSYALSRYFDYAAWITRDGVVSLSLDPNDTVRKSSSEKEIAWNCLASVENGFAGSSWWYNETCLKWQYDCHFSFAWFKDYWNLEPSRTASSYAEVVKAKCNP